MFLRRPGCGNIAQYCCGDRHHDLDTTKAHFTNHATTQHERAKQVLQVPLGTHDSVLGFACGTQAEQVVVQEYMLHVLRGR